MDAFDRLDSWLFFAACIGTLAKSNLGLTVHANIQNEMQVNGSYSYRQVLFTNYWMLQAKKRLRVLSSVFLCPSAEGISDVSLI